MTETKKELSSIKLMEKEKRLEARKLEINVHLLSTNKKIEDVQRSLLKKGWIRKLDGEWGIK
jgi:hypothetical protein